METLTATDPNRRRTRLVSGAPMRPSSKVLYTEALEQASGNAEPKPENGRSISLTNSRKRGSSSELSPRLEGSDRRSSTASSASRAPPAKRRRIFGHRTNSSRFPSVNLASVSSFESDVHPHASQEANAPFEGFGLVDTLIDAYYHGHRLVLSADHVWLAILSQLKYMWQHDASSEGATVKATDMWQNMLLHYLDKDTEQIRGELLPTSLHSDNFTVGNIDPYMRDFSCASKDLKKVVKESLPLWARCLISPEFSTSSDAALIAQAFVFFHPGPEDQLRAKQMHLPPQGFAGVELEGTAHDWRLLRKRVRSLCLFDASDPRLRTYATLLDPIMKKFRDTFAEKDEPSNEVLEFWAHAVHGPQRPQKASRGVLTGWVTAFCTFSAKHTRLPVSSEEGDNQPSTEHAPETGMYSLGGQTYPWLKEELVPPMHVEVPIKFTVRYEAVEEGEQAEEEEIDCTLVAGLREVGRYPPRGQAGERKMTATPEIAWRLMGGEGRGSGSTLYDRM